ncbi:hypothetical protein, partial [Streptomyces scabiei]|uniref:hypothetical protein n=1 Tax=Streptomyces scabiei TaxID=1930 RepID=UPI0038F6BD98
MRRVEALTGDQALAHLRASDSRLSEISGILKAPASEIVERVRALSDERKALVNEVAQLRRELAMGGGQTADETVEIGGIRFASRRLDGVSG